MNSNGITDMARLHCFPSYAVSCVNSGLR